MAREKLEADVLVNSKGAVQALQDVRTEADKIAALSPELTIDADDQATTTLNDIKEAVDEVEALDPKVEVVLTAEDEATKYIEDVEQKAKGLDGETYEAILRAEAKQAESELASIRSKLLTADGESYEFLIDAQDRVTAKLDTLRPRIDAIGTELRGVDDQSRSVGANFAGNLISEMPGVSSAMGPLNMAIGQFAEYATEGNINLKNLIKTGAGIAALSAGFLLIQAAMETIAKKNAWRKEQVEGYRAAVEEVGVGMGAIEEHLRTIDDWSFTDEGGFTDYFMGGDSSIPNVAAALGNLGFTVEEVSGYISDGEEGLAAFTQRMEETGLGSQVTGDYIDWLGEQQDAYAEATANATAETEFFSESQDSANRALQEFLDNKDPLSRFADEFGVLMEDMRDGSIDTDAAAQALNDLAAEGIPLEEALGLAQGALDEEAEAALAAEEATREHAQAIHEDQVTAIEAAIDVLEEELGLLEELADAQRSLAESYIDIEEAVEDVEKATDEYNRTVAEGSPEEQEEAAEDLRDSIIDLVEAQEEQIDLQHQANGTSRSRVQALESENAAYLDQARTLDGPARSAILEHVLRINGIPEERITEILTDTNPDDIAQVENELKGLTKARRVAIEADTVEHTLKNTRTDLENLTGPKYVPIYASPNFSAAWNAIAAIRNALSNLSINLGVFATGSPYTPSGMALVGEEGPELVALPRGSTVTNARQTKEKLDGSGSGSANTYNQTIINNFPTGTNPTRWVQEERKYRRLQGNM